MTWTIVKLLDWATGFFLEKGIASPRLDAELLLAHTLGLGRVQLYVQFDRPLTEAELARFKELLKRRAAREPLAYITGTKEFFSLPFDVTPAVLIPRPETEELVEWALQWAKQRGTSSIKILDLATGSGCLLISLLKNLPVAAGIGVDISVEALAVAARNAEKLGVGDRSTFIHHDLHQPWPPELQGPFDLITANLPYVSAAEHALLQPEVRDFEPRTALVPGTTGAELFAAIFPHIAARAAPDHLVLFEMGMEQGGVLGEMATQLIPGVKVEVIKDLSGRPRILSLAQMRLSLFDLPGSSGPTA